MSGKGASIDPILMRKYLAFVAISAHTIFVTTFGINIEEAMALYSNEQSLRRESCLYSLSLNQWYQYRRNKDIVLY